MAEIKSRADVVAARMARWAPELDEIAQSQAEQAARDAEAREALEQLDALRERAMARFAQLENHEIEGTEAPADPEGDEAIRILAELGESLGGADD